MYLKLTLIASALFACNIGMMAEIYPTKSTLKVSAGSLETFKLASPQLGRDVQIDVLLPEGYDGKTPRSVVYMHDGQNLFDATSTWNHQSWEIDEAVERLKPTERPIVVGVYSQSETRLNDLMPNEIMQRVQKPVIDKYLGGMWDGIANGDQYLEFITSTLKPEIDAHYATLPGRDHTSVMGSSMGGLISLYAICKYPQIFGSAACLSTHTSGSHTLNQVFPTAFNAYVAEKFPLDGQHKVYFDTGDQTIDANYLAAFPQLQQILSDLDLIEKGLAMTEVFLGHDHSEKCWASRVDIPLKFILEPIAQTEISK